MISNNAENENPFGKYGVGIAENEPSEVCLEVKFEGWDGVRVCVCVCVDERTSNVGV